MNGKAEIINKLNTALLEDGFIKTNIERASKFTNPKDGEKSISTALLRYVKGKTDKLVAITRSRPYSIPT